MLYCTIQATPHNVAPTVSMVKHIPFLLHTMFPAIPPNYLSLLYPILADNTLFNSSTQHYSLYWILAHNTTHFILHVLCPYQNTLRYSKHLGLGSLNTQDFTPKNTFQNVSSHGRHEETKPTAPPISWPCRRIGEIASVHCSDYTAMQLLPLSLNRCSDRCMLHCTLKEWR